MLSVVLRSALYWVSYFIYCYAECHFAECRFEKLARDKHSSLFCDTVNDEKKFYNWQIVFICCVLKSWLLRQILDFELKNKIFGWILFHKFQEFPTKFNSTQFWQSECSFPEFQTILLVSNDLCFMETCYLPKFLAKKLVFLQL